MGSMSVNQEISHFITQVLISEENYQKNALSYLKICSVDNM